MSLRGERAVTPVFDGLWRRSNPERLASNAGLLRGACHRDARLRAVPSARNDGSFLSALKLQLGEPRVETASRSQRLMRAFFDDASFVQH